jgi:hypothetical protein
MKSYRVKIKILNYYIKLNYMNIINLIRKFSNIRMLMNLLVKKTEKDYKY